MPKEAKIQRGIYVEAKADEIWYDCPERMTELVEEEHVGASCRLGLANLVYHAFGAGRSC